MGLPGRSFFSWFVVFKFLVLGSGHWLFSKTVEVILLEVVEQVGWNLVQRKIWSGAGMDKVAETSSCCDCQILQWRLKR